MSQYPSDPEVKAAPDSSVGEPESGRLLNGRLVEKSVLVALVVVTFARLLPSESVTSQALSIGVAAVVVLNLWASEWLRRRGTGSRAMLREFVIVAAVNLGLVLLRGTSARTGPGGYAEVGAAVLFALLLTLIVVLYDTYRT